MESSRISLVLNLAIGIVVVVLIEEGIHYLIGVQQRLQEQAPK